MNYNVNHGRRDSEEEEGLYEVEEAEEEVGFSLSKGVQIWLAFN